MLQHPSAVGSKPNHAKQIHKKRVPAIPAIPVAVLTSSLSQPALQKAAKPLTDNSHGPGEDGWRHHDPQILDLGVLIGLWPSMCSPRKEAFDFNLGGYSKKLLQDPQKDASPQHPSTLNPKPRTINPEPEILNLKP